MGQTKHGLYVDSDECEGIDVADLHAYYGTTPDAPMRRRRSEHTGAGHPPEEDDSDTDPESDEPVSSTAIQAEDVVAAQEINVRHPEIPVPKHSCPFEQPELEEVFFTALNEARSRGYVPVGYGAHADELEEVGGFEEIEVIRFGRRGRKELEVALPEATWRRRMELWVQGLHMMCRILYEVES